MPLVNVRDELYEKLRRVCEVSGYRSVEELIDDILTIFVESWEEEKSRGRNEEQDGESRVLDRLRRLGYV